MMVSELSQNTGIIENAKFVKYPLQTFWTDLWLHLHKNLSIIAEKNISPQACSA